MNRDTVSKTAPTSLRAYAKHRKALGLDGGSDAAVRKAIRDQRIVEGVTADGKIIADIADAEWKRNTAPRPFGSAQGKQDRPQARPHPRARKAGGTPPSSTPHVAPPVASPPPLSFGGSNYQLDRARRENVKLRKEVIELRKLEEKFVNADEVKVAYFNEVRTLRDRGFNIPDRIAAQLAAESEVKKCWEILMSELRQLFQNCADGWVSPMEPGSSENDTPGQREKAVVER